MLPDEKAATAAGFLLRAVAFYRRCGINVERVPTDNGGAYLTTIHALACKALGIRHSRTRPKNAPPLTAGSSMTTINADTQPSATDRPPPEPNQNQGFLSWAVLGSNLRPPCRLAPVRSRSLRPLRSILFVLVSQRQITPSTTTVPSVPIGSERLGRVREAL